MAIQMTRQQYEQAYGIKPVISTSTFDTTPAPLRMTRAEYNETYYGKDAPTNNPIKNVTSGSPAFPAQPDASVASNFARSLGNLPGSIYQYASGSNFPQKLAESAVVAKDILFTRGVKQGGKDLASVLKEAPREGFSLYKDIGEYIYKNLEQNVVSEKSTLGGLKVSTGQALSKVAEAQINDPLLIPSLFIGGGIAKGTDVVKKVASPVTSKLGGFKLPAVRSGTERIEKELFDIENNYVKTRAANEYSKDAGAASRKRIADTDVLAGAVDIDGTIRTKQPGGAIEQYKAQTIDGVEGAVRNNLVRLDEKVNLAQVERELRLEINRSGLEGSDLLTALNGLKKEIAGLKLRADEFGDIPLYKVHDAKISTTNGINYATPPNESSYRKAVARTYKTIVEDKSKFNVKEVNKELANYYDDLSRLERLDGRKAKGGRLGKYFAQISGNIVGGATGAAIGGPVGAAIGTIAGGEAAALIKGKTLAGTFGAERGLKAVKNPILEAARARAGLPPEVNLKMPDQKLGAPKGIVKTREVNQLEREIAKNVEAQKKAIKAGDFTLVTALKEIYATLVEKLKEVIKILKDERGFVNFGGEIPKKGQSNKDGSRKTQYKATPITKSSSIDKKSSTDSASKQDELRELSMSLENSLQNQSSGYRERSLKFLRENPEEIKKGTVDLREVEDGRIMIDDGRHRLHVGVEKGIVPNIVDVTARYTGKPSKKVATIVESFKSVKPTPIRGDGGKFKGSTSNKEEEGFKNFSDLSTKLLGKLEGRTTVSKQFISDLTNSPDLKQPEKDLFRKIFEDEGGTINVKDFANKVKSELLPLKIKDSKGLGYSESKDRMIGRYENISLPSELRGNVKNYKENIYESPIKTSAGSTHFSGSTDNYFAHSRIEDMADGKTRRVIEAQSDLFQKGRLEGEAGQFGVLKGNESRASIGEEELAKRMKVRDVEIAKLEPYRNTWHERLIREEVKQAAKDGKTKLQFPTGETAMKIEGLGNAEQFNLHGVRGIGERLTPDNMKVGQEVLSGNTHAVGDSYAENVWVITRIDENGKFQAVPKGMFENVAEESGKYPYPDDAIKALKDGTFPRSDLQTMVESFDISGKVDQNNPIYKFYEKEVARYLKNKYGAELVTDAQGVTWMEVDISKGMAKQPVEAFGVAPLVLDNEE